MKIYNFVIFLSLQPWKRPLPLNIMVICPEHHKPDQNLKFTPLSETSLSIPAPFISAIETKSLVYVLINGTIMFFVCATSSQVWISFFESWVWPPLLLGEFTFLCFCLGFQSSHLGSVRTTHFTFLLVCVVIVFITQVIPKVFLNYIIIQSLLFTSLKLRE